MERYDYMEQMKADILEWLECEVMDIPWSDFDELEYFANTWLYDNLWNNDSITGNASGSYFCNTWAAEEALCHNFDLLSEALFEFGCDTANTIEHGAEYCDVTIRCYLLGQAINETLDCLNVSTIEELKHVLEED